MITHKQMIGLSAGGTGGHIFPAAALGQELLARGYPVALITDKRGCQYTEMFPDMPIHVLKSGGLTGGIWGKIKSASALGIGVLQARRLLKELQPSVVVGFGGYPSVPAMYAAQQRGIPTIIHEQNAILGRANVFLASKAQGIALSLPQTNGLIASDYARAVVTGNPIRHEIAILATKPYPALTSETPLNIVVMGGSQGASIFADVLPIAISKLAVEYRQRLFVTQQVRGKAIDSVREIYQKAGVKAYIVPFLTDVAGVLEKAHLIIARSGASTVAEVTAAGRPAIFVPYPHHADHQQKINADVVANKGGAWVILQNDFTVEAVSLRIKTFFHNPDILPQAATYSLACGKPDAAQRLSDFIVRRCHHFQRATAS